MELVISEKSKVKQFETIFKHLKHISVDVNLIFTEEGLYTQGMCSSHVSLFELNLDKSWFQSYSVTNESLILGVNCEMLFKCISCLEENQIISMKSDGGDSIELNFTGDKSVNKHFMLPMMSIDSEQMEIPEVEYSADITMLSEQLDHLVSELNDFGNVVNITCNEENIIMDVLGEMGNMTLNIKEEDIIEYALEENENPEKGTEFADVLKMSYALEFIKNVCLFSKLNKEIKMHISEEYPIKFEYSLDIWSDSVKEDGEEEDIETINYIRFFVAPKIED